MNQMRKIPPQIKSKDAEQPLVQASMRDPQSPFLTVTNYRGFEFDRLCLVAQHAIQEGRVYEKEVSGRVRKGYNHYNPDGTTGGFVELSASISYSVIVESGAMVLDYPRVFVYARVGGNSIVSGQAKVHGNAILDGNSLVTDTAEVCGDARITNSKITGESKIHGNARIVNTEVHNRQIGTGVIKI